MGFGCLPSISQPISTSTPICLKKNNQKINKAKAKNSSSDDEVEVVWQLPVSKTPPNVPITRPQNVSTVRQKVKYLHCYYVVGYFILFLIFCLHKSKCSEFRPKVVKVCSVSNSLPPLGSRPNKKTAATEHNPDATTLVFNRTGGNLSTENVQQATTEDEETENLAWDIQSTDLPVSSSDDETFSVANFDTNSCKDTSNSSSPTPIPEDPDDDTVTSSDDLEGEIL